MVVTTQRAQGFTTPAGVKVLVDFNPEFGGPLRKDRLWFYTSFRYWRNNRTVAQTFNTDGSQALDEQLLMHYSGTVTNRLTDKTRLSGYIDWNKKQRDHRRDQQAPRKIGHEQRPREQRKESREVGAHHRGCAGAPEPVEDDRWPDDLHGAAE